MLRRSAGPVPASHCSAGTVRVMTSEPPPSSSPPPPRFRSKMRGYDTVEVDRTISDLLAEQKRLTEERASLQARLDALGESDLTAELTAVSKDTADILEAAKRAAAGMRDRAAADAARWRQEATEAASGLIEQAAADAETMRRSAWDTGTQLLADADAEMASQRSELERETVDRRADSEREAHQHLANARSEAEAIVSRARTTAEEALEEARRRHDEIGEQIRSSIEQAEGKVRGLEERRAELTAEAEKAEADLQALDDEIAARRQRLEVVDLEIPGEIGAGEPTRFPVDPGAESCRRASERHHRGATPGRRPHHGRRGAPSPPSIRPFAGNRGRRRNRSCGAQPPFRDPGRFTDRAGTTRGSCRRAAAGGSCPRSDRGGRTRGNPRDRGGRSGPGPGRGIGIDRWSPRPRRSGTPVRRPACTGSRCRGRSRQAVPRGSRLPLRPTPPKSPPRTEPPSNCATSCCCPSPTACCEISSDNSPRPRTWRWSNFG